MLPSSKKISELQTKVQELEAQLNSAAETHKVELEKWEAATEELATAHSEALLAKESELAGVKTELAQAKEATAKAEKDFEDRIKAEVVRRCAEAGLKTPIVRDPAVNTSEDLDAVRERMANSTDPKERFELARQARELRFKKAA